MTRVGASQAFFNIVAHMNAKRLISDVASLETIMKAVSIDTFEAMMKPFDEFGQMIQQARVAVEQLGIDVGNAMIEFEKFYGSGQMMQDVAAGVVEVGEAFAMTATESLAAASRAAQVANIIGQANVELLVEQAMVLAEISDLNVEESQRALIKLQQQANIMYGEYTAAQVRGLPLEMQRQVLLDNTSASLDALNTIANRSVALEGDLVQTMTNFASQGNLVGESFEFMAAASATLLEAGEEQGTAGRALRMMYARLGGNISGAADQIEALGIKVRDNNGNMLTMQEVLGNVSSQGWDTMSASLKMNIAQTISGNRHYVRFIKLMDNYERTVRLAEEGQLGLDSATTQAERALSRQSKQLEISQARMENLKATIGQQLTPAFIETNNVQSEYLEQVSLLIGGTGGLGKAFGRLAASLKITGGFVKFGLALQSVGIGFGMYESVMKSLHDVEIANQSLHSKQANYLDYAVTRTKEQEELLKIMQYLQQRMNANSEQSRLHQLEINHILQQRREIEEVLTPLQEKYNTNLTKRANISQEITSLNVLQTDLAKRQMSSYQTKLAYMEHDKRIGGDLLERQKQLYSERTFSEEAYKRQFIADVQTMSNLRKGDIKQIVEGNEKLRQRHSALQDLKAANEAARAARDENDRGLIRTMALKKKDSDALLERLKHEMVLAARSRKATKDEGQKNFYKTRLDGLRQFYKQVKNMEEGLFRVGTGGLQKAGFDEMTRLLKETGGAIIQSDRVLQAYNSNLIKHGTIERQLSVLKGMKTKTNKGLQFDLSKINELTADDIILQQQLEPLMDRINQMDEEKIANSKEYLAVTRILEGVEKDKAAIMEKYSRDEKVRADEDMARRDMAMRQMTFATTSLISVLGGASNSAFGVTASMVAMGSQIGFATGQVVKSTKALYESSKAAALNAGKFTDAAEASAYYKKNIAKTVGVIVLITAAITAFNHQQMKQQKAVERTRKEIEELRQVMSAMEADTKLFGTEDGLAGQLGIANYELGELVNNADLTAQIFNQLNNESHGLDRNMQSIVNNSVNMLSTLMAIQEQSTILNAGEVREAVREIDRAFDSYDNFFDALILGYGDKDDKDYLARQFLDDQDARMFEDGLLKFEIVIDEIVKQMKEGRELTEKEWYALEDALGDNDWAASVLTNLEKIDSLTMSEEMLSLVTKNLTENNNTLKESFVQESEAISNLEEDIRNFANTREELFFGGKYGNITGSLYKQVVQQGVGVLYNKQEVIVSNVFHGFFNEQEAADRIKNILRQELATI